ncbi:hypothetical protein PanWU01x14_370100, partial [Parasponia andersonii]
YTWFRAVIRDSMGFVLRIISEKYNGTLPLASECLSIREGLSFALISGLKV